MKRSPGLYRRPDGAVLLFGDAVLVSIDPAALPLSIGVPIARAHRPTQHTILGALRNWCAPVMRSPDGRICRVVVSPVQLWRALGEVLALVPDDAVVGLARVEAARLERADDPDRTTTPALAVTGDGWEVLVAGMTATLDARQRAAAPAVDLPAPPRKRGAR